MSESAAVLFVNEAFYQAFRDRDLETMDGLWAREAPVACVHPGWQALTDRAEIMDSWQGILGNPGSPQVMCRNAEAFVLGAVAFVVCYEVIADNVLAATNLFVHEGGAWKLAHHHAGPCNAPPPLAAEDESGPQRIQ